MKIKRSLSSELSLPDEPSEPKNDLRDFITMIYGREKIGKTSLAAQFEDVMFLLFEPGGKSLRIYSRSVSSWREFKEYVVLLEKNKSRFANVCIDTVDICFKFAEEYMCNKLGIDHPSEEEWGKGWGLIQDEFTRQIVRLCNTGRGVIFISHASEREIKKRKTTVHRVIPTMSGQARKILEPMVDIWGYYYWDGDNRSLQIVGDEDVSAGHRLIGHFDGITHIPMGTSAKESYENFIAAFDNRLKIKGGPVAKKGDSEKSTVKVRIRR
jgi:hypothetical protein